MKPKQPPSVDEVRAAIAPLIERIKQMPALDQVQLCQELNTALLDGQAQIATVRRQAVRALRIEGFTLKEVAEATGMSLQRVHQLETGWSRPSKRTPKK